MTYLGEFGSHQDEEEQAQKLACGLHRRVPGSAVIAIPPSHAFFCLCLLLSVLLFHSRPSLPSFRCVSAALGDEARSLLWKVSTLHICSLS